MIAIKHIKTTIQQAATNRQKMATFHFQVLENAEALKDTDAESFCKTVSVPASYSREFRKMIALAELMKQEGKKIA